MILLYQVVFLGTLLRFDLRELRFNLRGLRVDLRELRVDLRGLRVDLRGLRFRVPRKTTWYSKIIVTVNFPVVN